MKRTDVIKAVAEKLDFTQKDVKSVLDGLQEVVFEHAKDEDVPVFGGLTLTSVIKPSRTCRNPRTGEMVNVPEKRVPKAKLGSAFREAVKY